MSKYEIEFRGLLPKKTKNKLEKFLARYGKKIKSYKRIHWVYKKSWDQGLDLRLKKTNGTLEISLKVGNPGKSHRREISLPLPHSNLSDVLEFMKHLGYDEGFKAWRNANIYQYKNIEWAIVEVPNHSAYFEAEILADTKKEARKAEEVITQVTKELGLRIYGAEETMAYIAKLDKEANKYFRK